MKGGKAMQSAYLMLPTGAPTVAMACLPGLHAPQVGSLPLRSICSGLTPEGAHNMHCSHPTGRKQVIKMCRRSEW